VAALLFSDSETPAGDLIAHGADGVYWCKGAEDYDAALWVPGAEQLAREIAPRVILAGHTQAGAELAPRLAFRLKGAIATGCTAVSLENGNPLFTRACFGGNVRETLSLHGNPAVATVKAGAGTAQRDDARRGAIVAVAAPHMDTRTRVIARERDSAGPSRLEEARVIVSGGRGLEGAEGFRILETLAAQLGGAVGASRVPCDLGWCPHSWQIGLTGKSVAPELYIAVGISGAGHHLAGCGNSGTIVAINTDADAAIFKEARFGVIGDYREVVPALVAALKEDS
jgi:electron transfer flavoprotein alpha subunit